MKVNSAKVYTQRDHYNLGRYASALHAMQSGVKFDQETGSDDGSPKHLRTGVNSALIESGVIAQLLQAKGIITQEEYLEAIANAAEEEAKRYEELLSRKLGKPVKLL